MNSWVAEDLGSVGEGPETLIARFKIQNGGDKEVMIFDRSDSNLLCEIRAWYPRMQLLHSSSLFHLLAPCEVNWWVLRLIAT
jgi:hypothetical protein